MAGSPATQLVSLCTGYGAVPSRIPKIAPFLQHLPATQHAHEVLGANGRISWEHAARELLNCVTRPGGAAGFDARTARFARACLALDGALASYAQRMDDLANDPNFDYWRSRNAQDKQRDEAMGILAARLAMLTAYPCDPGKIESAIQEMLDLTEIVRTRHLAHLDDHEIKGVYEELFRRLVSAAEFFESYNPRLTLRERLSTIIAAVAMRPYRQLYESLKPRSIDLLVPPREAWDLFEGRPASFDPESPETERTMRLIERLVLDIEERNDWAKLLQAEAVVGARAQDAGGLSDAETLRLRAYFERLADEY